MANEAWQSAWVEVLPDFSDFKKNANGQMSGILGAAGTAGGLSAGKNAGSGILGGIKAIGPALLGIVASLGIGRLIGEAIGNAINYGLDSVDLASGLEQSSGAVEAVFKDQSKIIQDFAKGAAKNLGLSRSSYQSFATIVGAQLKNLGIPIGKVAGQTNDLIDLGADLAAQFGGPTSDAVNALSSLLRGERDPIERYGVGIKQADINARLAAQGLDKLTGDAKKQAEIQATLAILYEQTADAQGTFAREGDTLAGQQQRLQASLEDTQTKLGESLLPAFTGLAQFANDTLVPRLDGVIDKIGPKLGAALEAAQPGIEKMLDKVSPLVENFLVWAGEDGIPGVIQGMSDFADAVPGWVDAFKRVDEVASDFFDTLVVKQADLDSQGRTFENSFFNMWMNPFAKPEDTGLFKFLHGVKDGMTEFGSGVGDEVLKIGGHFKKIPAVVNDAINVDTLFRTGQNLVDGLELGINSHAARVSQAALAAAQGAVISVNKYLKISSPSKVFEEIGGYMSEGMAIGVTGKAGMVAKAVGSMVSIPDITAGVSLSSVGGGNAGTSRAGVRDVTLVNPDPHVLLAMLKQELGGKLVSI